MTSPTTPRDAISVLAERLREDIWQLRKMAELATFGGLETGVRVKDPSALLADLVEAATEISSLRERVKTAAQWQQWAEDERAKFEARAETAEQWAKEAWDLYVDALLKLAKAMKALKPFADEAAAMSQTHNGDTLATWVTFTIGELRAARAITEEK